MEPAEPKPSLREKMRERLIGWQLRMQEVQASSVYAFLSATFLWPIVEAARQGEWAALTPVLASLGGNLVANHIQQWQNEADGAWKIEQAVTHDPSLREALDAVLQHLQAFEEAERALPESDRQWFMETLRGELERYGNLERFAHVTFSGNMTFGDVIVHVHPAPSRDTAALLKRYRRGLLTRYRHLPLRSIDMAASDATGTQAQLDLARVYIDLNTTSSVAVPDEEKLLRLIMNEEHEHRSLSALQALINHRQLVLLGEPGSGKSTFLSHLALCLAAHSLEPEAGWLSHLPGWLAMCCWRWDATVSSTPRLVPTCMSGCGIV